MYAKICTICKNKYFENDSALHNYCVVKKLSKRSKEQTLFRTSTPIAEYENGPSSSFSDPVADFFYQTWKSGLHSGVRKTHKKSPNQWNHQPHIILQPVYFAPQFVYVYVQYNQQVGYRPDGTFGILPSYWTWNYH